MSSPQKTALIIGASGYIGGAVARAFTRVPYHTLGLIRSGSSGPHQDLAAHNVKPIVGSISDIPAAVTSIQSHSTTFDVIATEDRSPTHFDDTVDLVTTLAKLSNKGDGSPNLKPHTEESPLNTPPTLAPRAQNALRFLEHADLFDAVVTRPTNVHGYSSSYYGELIEFALVAKEKGLKLMLPGDPRTIMHSINVDDCGEAYLAIAEHLYRKQIAGEVFNISSGQKYETLIQIGSALEKAFQLKDGVACAPQQLTRTNLVFAWFQWVDSEIFCKLTGWKDTRPMFAEDMGRYRKEFEEAVRAEDVTLLRVKPRIEKSIKHYFPSTESLVDIR
ncbi:NAD(P)-binding protein [Stipitochalara longipes BDJ]|nr:NAD(P)-binding protein [Stipitochalara longipes BDJ]